MKSGEDQHDADPRFVAARNSHSPDLNPIEQAFAKLETLLRNANARSVEETWRAIGTLLDEFSSTECANYIRNSGHAALKDIRLYTLPWLIQSRVAAQ